jgi:hypothetical protein
VFLIGGRALDNVGPATQVPKLTKLRIPISISSGVSVRGLSFVRERETAQTVV